MSTKAVLFDLDGTLLPMVQDEFVKEYFRRLTAAMKPYGYEPKMLMDAIWEGIHVMIENDGTRMNEPIFWEAFERKFGRDVKPDMPRFDRFYREEFDKVQCIVKGQNPHAVALVRNLRRAGVPVVLATNPVFPPAATECRIRWAGLEPEDFTLYTTFHNTGFCKPNPAYYTDIAGKIGVSPDECIMIGNDIKDDMSAALVGMDVFFLDDYPVNREGADESVYKRGDFIDLTRYLEKKIPALSELTR